MIDYESKVLCEERHGPAVLKFSLNVFIQNGFAVVKKDRTGYEIQGPGMISSRQNPLLGISRLMGFLEDNHLNVKAEFGAIRKLRKLMVLFLAVLALFLTVFFAVLFHDRPNYNFWLPLAPFIPWPFLIPLMVRMFFRRTQRALDTLINNALTWVASEDPHGENRLH